MALISFDNILVEYGTHKVLDHVVEHIEPGERICLIGKNGAGKSTLLKIIAGQLEPDDGRVVKDNSVKVSYLSQKLPEAEDIDVYDYVATGLEDVGTALKNYHHASLLVEKDPSETNLGLVTRYQQEIEQKNGWQFHNYVQTMLSKLSLPENAKMATLSGGWRRRVDLARALVSRPDVLMLDEPTNHLDIEAILWLEEVLKGFRGAVVFVSHDRRFIDSLATRLLEIDRAQLTSWPGNYSHYLVKKQEQLEIEEKQNALFDKRLAQEEVWIRQGIKARRTRNEGRVRALKALREERKARVSVGPKANINTSEGAISGKLVCSFEKVSFGFKENPIVENFSLKVLRGDKIGIIGPNGVGKTTLIKLILGQLEAESGQIQRGTNLQIAYFDQFRNNIDLDKSVADNVADGQSELEVEGKKRHVISYLADYLFPPERARSPASILSGGELNRLMLAKLFLKPFNMLVLDEPTNDLDMETLELLEELLNNTKATVLLVCHDRQFLDNIVTSTLSFDLVAPNQYKLKEYVGGYEDWLRQKPIFKEDKPQSKVEAKANSPKNIGNKKLSYKEKRELEALPQEIERLETEIEQLEKEVSSGDFYSQSHELVQERLNLLAIHNDSLEKAYQRWDELEEKTKV